MAITTFAKLPAGLHFQVALPTPHAAIGGYFVQDWEMLHAAYHDAIVDDISRMLEEIPAEDLVIQWDYCTELCDTVGVDTDNREIDALWPWNPKGTTEQKFATHTAKEYIAPLTEGIPAEVLYGYHLCLGTWPKCPLTPVRDLTLVVRMANAIVANTPRRVDFVHLPMTKEADRQFCAPLTDLDIGEARVFLGLEWKEDGTRCCGGLKLPASFCRRSAYRITAVMAAIPSNRCPNCSPISEPEQMRSAPADASSAIPITRALGDRAIDHDLLLWCAQHAAPVMAYSPPWGSEQSVCDPTLARMGASHGCSAAAVALAWTIRSGSVIAIPKSAM